MPIVRVLILAAGLAAFVSCASPNSTKKPPQSDAATEAGATPDAAGMSGDAATCSADEGLRLYDERIDPLFRDDRPSTCNQCHLSGINLRQYVQATPCETYACMVQQRLIDEEQPKDSKVLAWIERATPKSELITQQVIDAEYSAFLEWISFNSRCQECKDVACPLPTDGGGAFCPDEGEDPHAVLSDAGFLDPGGCTESDLEAVFRNSVYSQRGRCSPCHFNTPESGEYEAPIWIEVTPDCETASRLTMDHVLRNGYLDLDDPTQSLLLLKPLAESNGGLPHGGGDKFDSIDDPGYQSFLHFIERLKACESDSGQ
jgi:hypothetical protein